MSAPYSEAPTPSKWTRYGCAASAPHLRQQKSTNPHSAPNSASNGSTPLPQWIGRLKEEGYTILSVEQAEDSISLDKFIPEKGKKYALVFGNEVEGVQQEVVSSSDGVLEIPQYGTKHSLNISVTAGIVLWHFRLTAGI